MANLETINSRGLYYIAWFIADVVNYEGKDERKGEGMWIESTYVTPETCYWLHQFLKETGDTDAFKKAMKKLKDGTNHPENL